MWHVCYYWVANMHTLLLTRDQLFFYWDSLCIIRSMYFTKYTISSDFRYSVIQNRFSALKTPYASTVHPFFSPTPNSWQPLICFIISFIHLIKHRILLSSINIIGAEDARLNKVNYCSMDSSVGGRKGKW